MIPAKRINKPPKFNFAVLSVHKGSEIAELESSFLEAGVAQGYFERQYSKWGLTDTNFYLVDWQRQTVLQQHIVF